MTLRTAGKATLAIAVALAIAVCIHLAVTTNYGGDNDTYLILSTFLHLLKSGVYNPSRFTGYPVAEVGIGYLAWLGGSALSNLGTYLLFLASALLIPFSLRRRISFGRYLAFLALALTAPVLAFDNIQSMDYAWALFFWAAGCVCLRRFNNKMLAVVSMALSIGSRPSFALFAVGAIVLTGWEDRDRRLPSWRFPASIAGFLLATLFAGGLFYLPNWFGHSFGLSWISSAPPDGQGLTGLVARFVYKTAAAIGLLQTAVLGIYMAARWLALRRGSQPERSRPAATNKTNPDDDARFLLGVMALNLLLFMRMPVELSYLQPFLICLFLLLASSKAKHLPVLIGALILLNLFNWIAEPEILAISYQPAGLCGPVVAEGAQIRPALLPGRVEAFVGAQRLAECHMRQFANINGTNYTNVARQGLPLRLAERAAR